MQTLTLSKSFVLEHHRYFLLPCPPSLFKNVFSATTSQKLSGITTCSGDLLPQESVLNYSRSKYTVYSMLLEERPIEMIGMVKQVG